MLLDRDRSALPSTLGGPRDEYGGTWSFVRALSRAERELLIAAGASEERVRDSVTRVTYLSPSVRARRFSQVQASTLPGMPSADPGAVQ